MDMRKSLLGIVLRSDRARESVLVIALEVELERSRDADAIDELGEKKS